MKSTDEKNIAIVGAVFPVTGGFTETLGLATLSVGIGVAVGASVGTMVAVGIKVGVAEPEASKLGPLVLSAAKTVNFLVTVSHSPVAPF